MLPPGSCVAVAMRLGIITRTRSVVTNIWHRAGRCVTISRRLKNNPSASHRQ